MSEKSTRDVVFALLRLAVIGAIIIAVYRMVSCEVDGLKYDYYRSGFSSYEIPVTRHKEVMRIRIGKEMTQQPTIYIEDDEVLDIRAWDKAAVYVKKLYKVQGLQTRQVKYCAPSVPKRSERIPFFDDDSRHNIWINAPCFQGKRTADLRIWVGRDSSQWAKDVQYKKFPEMNCNPEPWNICSWVTYDNHGGDYRYSTEEIPVTRHTGKIQVSIGKEMTQQPTVYVRDSDALDIQAWDNTAVNVRQLYKIQGLQTQQVKYCAPSVPAFSERVSFFDTDTRHNIWISAPCLKGKQTVDLSIGVGRYSSERDKAIRNKKIPEMYCSSEPWDICYGMR